MPPRLNLFLHQVTPNRGLAQPRAAVAQRAAASASTNPPLALDLHYLVTAYGIADFQAEILLGYAMHLLHERPVLDRAAIRRALDPSPLDVSMLPPAFQALAASDLADQVELIKITPAAMSSDEMSQAVVGDPDALPAVGRLPGVGGADRGHEARPQRRCRCCRAACVDPVTHRDRGVVVKPDLLPPLPDAAHGRAAGAADRGAARRDGHRHRRAPGRRRPPRAADAPAGRRRRSSCARPPDATGTRVHLHAAQRRRRAERARGRACGS